MKRIIAGPSSLCLLLICFLPSVANAVFFKPGFEVRTVKTQHFIIHYPKEVAPVAQDLMVIAERVHDKLSKKLKYSPRGRTHLLLVDKTDSANGLASVLPDNYILLYVTPPEADSSLDHYRDYLELLFTHEYTHILHIDQHHPWASFGRWIFGKIIAPNGLSPGWMREGMAAWEETDETGFGRGNSAYTEMVIRSAILENKFPKIDEVAGLSVRGPGTEGQYYYGVKFYQWLSAKFGEASLQKYMEKYSSSLWIFSFNNKAKRVYGKSFYQLWREWRGELTSKYEQLRQVEEARGVSQLDLVAASQNNQHGYTVHPKGAYAFAEKGFDEPASVKIFLPSAEAPQVFHRDILGQMSFSGDGRVLAFAATSAVEKYSAYSEVYFYDIEKKRTARAFLKAEPTKALRASDPDFSPLDGGSRWVVMVRTNLGTDNLYVYDGVNKTGYFLTEARSYTQFSNPRFSPDGSKIVVSRHDHQGQRNIIIYNNDGKELSRVTWDEATDNQPIWSADGRMIYFESDRNGIPNIYRYTLASRRTETVTNVLTGVFEPQINPNNELVVRYYTTGKNELRKMDFGGKNLVANKSLAVREGVSSYEKILSNNPAPKIAEVEIPTAKPYSPLPQILVPKYIMPTFLTLDDAFLFGFATGRYDPLYRHSWLAGMNYRTDAQFPGLFASYSYMRYNPSFFTGYARYALNWGNLFGNGKDFIEQRDQFYLGTAFTVKRNLFSTSYFYELRDNFSAIPAGFVLPNLDSYAGLRFKYVYSKLRRFANSISPEGGREIKLNVDFTDDNLGSAAVNEQTVVYGDTRFFLEMPWSDHHVMAFRAAGGWVWGDREFSGSFRFGGPFGDGVLAGYSARLFPFRGLPGVTFSSDRVALVSTEYRMPLGHVDRGLGTLPVFLRDLHLTLFADYGDSWVRGGKDTGNFFDNFFLGTGAELQSDFVLGYGLPVSARLGYGIIVLNRAQVAGLTDSLLGMDISNGTVYFSFGTSF